MIIINIKENDTYLKEYIKLCKLEWGNGVPTDEYITNKLNYIKNTDDVISIIGLKKNNELIGFISLLKNDGEERKDLTPWYATNYIKKEYRGNGYSKILSNKIIEEAKKLGYKKIYLKSDLVNYYEKMNAIYLETLNNGERLYYINC